MKATPRNPGAVRRTASVLVAGCLSAQPSLAAGDSGPEVEEFSSDPFLGGWRVHGDPALFAWDADRKALAVTWDSSRPNSYFHRPLPRVLTRADDFAFGFTLRLESHAVGTTEGKPGTFQIALGLIRVADATAPDFQRGVFLRSRNLVEWTWFGADEAISPSVSPVMVPSDGRLPWAYADSFVALQAEVEYRFRLDWSATDGVLGLAWWIDGEPGPDLRPVRMPAGFSDFAVDALAVSSYSDAGQDPRFAGSVRASGWVDDIEWVLPPDPVRDLRFTGSPFHREVTFKSQPGWEYTLEVSTDLARWEAVGTAEAGTGGDLSLSDPRRVVFPEAYHRVRAVRP